MLDGLIKKLEEYYKDERKQRLTRLAKMAAELAVQYKNKARQLVRAEMRKRGFALFYQKREIEESLKKVRERKKEEKRKKQEFIEKIRRIVSLLKTRPEWTLVEGELKRRINLEINLEVDAGPRRITRKEFLHKLKELDECLSRVEKEEKEEGDVDEIILQHRLEDIEKEIEMTYKKILQLPEVRKLWGLYLHHLRRAERLWRLVEEENKKNKESKKIRGIPILEAARVKFDSENKESCFMAHELGIE